MELQPLAVRAQYIELLTAALPEREHHGRVFHDVKRRTFQNRESLLRATILP